MRAKKQSGFTLLEAMIVVAIIGILAAIAYPNYAAYVQRAKRSDAKNALIDLAARQERFRFGNNTYTPSLTALNLTTTSLDGYYNLAITSANANSFTATATPTSTQASDKCGTLSLTNTGQKGTVNSYGLTVQECWQ